MSEESNPPNKEPEYLKISSDPRGYIVDIKWLFKNPYQAGEVLGVLVNAISDSFQRSNPGREESAYLIMLEGMISIKNAKMHIEDIPDAEQKKTH